MQEWQSPVTPAGLADPEVDRYQPDAFGQQQQQPQQAAGELAYPEQQTVPDYMSGADCNCKTALWNPQVVCFWS